MVGVPLLAKFVGERGRRSVKVAVERRMSNERVVFVSFSSSSAEADAAKTLDETVKTITSGAEGVRGFIAEFGPFLTKEENAILEKRVEFMEMPTRTIENENGTHFVYCHWAEPNVRCGPDTCVCDFNGMNSARARAIIRRYEGLKRRILGL